MGANTFGRLFQVTTFGESHGVGLGCVIDGCPAGVKWDQQLLERQLQRRRPGASPEVTARAESDVPEILSGVYEGQTLGTPIAILFRNHDARSADYLNHPETTKRSGHADDLWREKFGHVDPRGGGRASGRETVARVAAGAVAQMLAAQLAPEMKISGWSSQIGPIALDEAEESKASELMLHNSFFADEFPVRMPDAKKAESARELLLAAKEKGLSYGGRATLHGVGVPKGLGQPVFHKLKSDLSAAMMSVGATSALSFGGETQDVARAEGSEFHARGGVYGGLRGGISTGEALSFHVTFKPTSSVLNVAKRGRHDPCIVPRAVVVLEAMAWLVLADHLLARRLDRVELGE